MTTTGAPVTGRGAPVGPGLAAGVAVPRRTRGRLVARRFVRRRSAVTGLVGVVALALLAVVGPMLLPWGHLDVDRDSFLSPPDGEHWWGTTQAGRDVLALTLQGLRTSMVVGLGVAVLQTAVAAVVGTVAACYGGWVDRAAQWVIDLLLVVPSLILVAVVAGRPGGPGASAATMVVVLAGLGWMLSARVVRSAVLAVTRLEYVAAARYMSVSTPRLIARHILPNISSLLVADATLALAGAVLAETSLSYFGLGVQAPATSLGTLIAEGQRTAATFPWVFLGPAGALVLLLVLVALVGDGLRDALDPRSGRP
ncbi:ABC transporter permease [Georgenia sp. SYP-B2076]|uniref:ABC transporter permease n=1 Tax=Georgenia sp. SYP-B2076 TaxID=2495881 RepID=UPI000F8F3206|nr:ABC transporter permease [Georgenia sp. SYP-B2076]